MQQSEEIGELVNALVQAQKTIDNPTKNKRNPHFKNDYADLESVLACQRSQLLANGITILQLPDGEGMTTRIMHTSGQWIEASVWFSESNPQKFGSALTYFRRYATQGVGFVVAEDDDDGNAAAAKEPNKEEVNW